MILLTHGYFLSEDEKERQIMKPYVPLGILYISAYLEKQKIDHKLFDSTFSDFETFRETLLKEKPGLIGIYTNLMTKLNVLKMITFIKQEKTLAHTKVILGGPEIRNNAENYLKHGADCLVIGEGEETFFEICEHFISKGELPKTINGIAFFEGDKLLFTPERTLIKDINTLPFPNRKKTDLTLYGNAWKKAHGYSMYSISTMRGCPYTCKWCSRAVLAGHTEEGSRLLWLKRCWNLSRTILLIASGLWMTYLPSVINGSGNLLRR
jgi:anaerobic magnesium-protoporphyrin IX monomethyl ester cyclase